MAWEITDYRFVCGNCRQWIETDLVDGRKWGECTAEIPIWLVSLLTVEHCLDEEHLDEYRKCAYVDEQAEHCHRFSPHPTRGKDV